MTQEITPLGTIDYTYDAVGRRESMTVAGLPTVHYDYYDNGWIENIRQDISGTEKRFNFTYDDAGRRKVLQYFQGTSPTAAMGTTYDYDISNRLLKIKHLNTAGVLDNLRYEYDPNGNRTRFQRNVAQPTRGEVLSTNYNDANQMLRYRSPSDNITYDDNGNMTSVTTSCGTTNYTWDVRNRLVGINGFDSGCSPLSASFQYDALGRRIEKTITDTVNGTRTTAYLYDGLDIIEEIEGGISSATYIRTMNIDEPLMRIEADGTIRHYKTDALGSIIGLTDDTGAIKTGYTYDPFGSVTVLGEVSDNPFQYTGRENDGTGLYYYRARYYSPDLQRFISEDPIRFAGGDVNFYAYVGNSPVNYVDPLGLAVGPPIFPPGLPRGELPGMPRAPDAPGSDEPGPGACKWVIERYCKYEDLSCPWDTTGPCIVKNLDKCHCLRWSHRQVLKCRDKVYR